MLSGYNCRKSKSSALNHFDFHSCLRYIICLRMYVCSFPWTCPKSFLARICLKSRLSSNATASTFVRLLRLLGRLGKAFLEFRPLSKRRRRRNSASSFWRVSRNCTEVRNTLGAYCPTDSAVRFVFVRTTEHELLRLLLLNLFLRSASANAAKFRNAER